jgi:hypothetical protein
VLVECVEIEHLVFDPDHLAASGDEMPAAYDIARIGARRLVERPGRGSTPVDQELASILVGEPDATDIPLPACGEVQAAEAQPVVHRGKLGNAVLVEPGKRVAFGAVGVGPFGASATDPVELLGDLTTQIVESGVEPVEVGLFFG